MFCPVYPHSDTQFCLLIYILFFWIDPLFQHVIISEFSAENNLNIFSLNFATADNNDSITPTVQHKTGSSGGSGR